MEASRIWTALFFSSFCLHLSLLTHPQWINASETIPECFSQVVAGCECLWWLLGSHFPQSQQDYAMGIQGRREVMPQVSISLCGTFPLKRRDSKVSVTLLCVACPPCCSTQLGQMYRTREISEYFSHLFCRGWVTRCKESHLTKSVGINIFPLMIALKK